MKKPLIAYFSPEFAINNDLPIYAGGLGVLAGDHLRSSDELGLNLVAIGLFYRYGYFIQKISKNGVQRAEYNKLNPLALGLKQVLNENGQPLILSIPLQNDLLYFQAFNLKIGSIDLFLLDTFIDENNEIFKNITDKLYGGDREHRLQQEILLGIGGIKLLENLNLIPEFIHINEGHAAFALLEWHKNFALKNIKSFTQSIELNKDKALFTTHTPVKHGNEVFAKDLIASYFENYVKNIDLDLNNFLEFGSASANIESETNHTLIAKNSLEIDEFSMTLLAFKLCSNYNAVSKLHGETSRDLWKAVFNTENSNEVPIKSITNGVDINYWTADTIKQLLNDFGIISQLHNINFDLIHSKFLSLDDKAIQIIRNDLKKKLIGLIRKVYRNNKPEFIKRDKFKSFDEILNEDTLTIGFSRRFAQYKRADLLFNDVARLKSLLYNLKSPVQFVFSGKSHPLDVEGKDMLKKVIKLINDNHLEKKIVFLENYDLEIAKYIVQGCDVWLNNPIKPLEASGTSGMKSALNGGINLSIEDGWWAEAYNGKNGFLIENGNSDEEVSNNLYNILENQLIPLYYNDSKKWNNIIKESMFTAFYNFGSCRMIEDYNNIFYKS